MAAYEQRRALLLELLAGMGACPAVSFLEGPVASHIRGRLAGMGLNAEHDRYGNIVVHRRGKGDTGEDQPPIAFVAHMDHPGFEALEWEGDTLIARALGGVPQACFSSAVSVEIVLPDGRRLSAETAGAHGPPDQRMVALHLNGDDSRGSAFAMSFPAAVVPSLPDFQFDGELVQMRALDDLAGCAAILAAMNELAAHDSVSGDVYAMFTRAEEVGLVGARLLAEEGLLPAGSLVVSLEASRTLPGAAIGEGPVIRVGDASFTFDAEAEGVLLKAREQLSEGKPGFQAQRQLMSGGTCEASAFRYHGYRTTGIAFPLGNYHNGAPDGGVEAEYIHIDDLVGGLDLILEAVKSVAQRRESRPWARMGTVPEEQRERLAKTTNPAL